MPSGPDDKPKLQIVLSSIKSIASSSQSQTILIIIAMILLLSSSTLLMLGLVAPTFDAHAWIILSIVWVSSIIFIKLSTRG